jgi:hypothetical protein
MREKGELLYTSIGEGCDMKVRNFHRYCVRLESTTRFESYREFAGL